MLHDSLESISCLQLVVEAFSLQKVVKILRKNGSWLVRSQVNMADEAKPRSPISTSEVLVV